MTLETKPLAEVTSRGVEALIQELGPSDAIRFINQFVAGFGDYTAERDTLFGHLTLDQILSQVGPPRVVEHVPNEDPVILDRHHAIPPNPG